MKDLENGTTDAGDARVNESPPFPTRSKLPDLEEKVLELAKEIIQNERSLIKASLTSLCLKILDEYDVKDIHEAISFLIENKFIIPKRAITRDDLLENENRRWLLDIIHARPGINTSELKRVTGINFGTIKWHLKLLGEFEMVRLEKFSNRFAYFPRTMASDRDWLYFLLNKPGYPKFLECIIEHPGLLLDDLLPHVGINKLTLLRKIRVLASRGIIGVKDATLEMYDLRVRGEYKPLILDFIVRSRKVHPSID